MREVVGKLAADIPLEAHHHDHALRGSWKGFRECHIKPDWFLIYRKEDDDVLSLARTGSHASLLEWQDARYPPE